MKVAKALRIFGALFVGAAYFLSFYDISLFETRILYLFGAVCFAASIIVDFIGDRDS